MHFGDFEQENFSVLVTKFSGILNEMFNDDQRELHEQNALSYKILLSAAENFVK